MKRAHRRAGARLRTGTQLRAGRGLEPERAHVLFFDRQFPLGVVGDMH